MKKSIVTLFTIFIVSFAFAQDTSKVKQDTVVVLSLKELQEFELALDRVIDSKNATKELVGYLRQKVRIVQPADKPKKP